MSAPLPEKCYEECLARYEGEIVTIERIYRGRGVRKGVVMAKILGEGFVKYVEFDLLEVVTR